MRDSGGARTVLDRLDHLVKERAHRQFERLRSKANEQKDEINRNVLLW
jgi:hypothetical protein